MPDPSSKAGNISDIFKAVVLPDCSGQRTEIEAVCSGINRKPQAIESARITEEIRPLPIG